MVSCGPSRASSDRLLVLEVSTNNDLKILKAISPSSGDQVFVALSDEWAECAVETGHIIRVILTALDGKYEPWDHELEMSEQPLPVTRDRNILIHHPDTLIPSTAVADSFMCLRRSVLNYRVPSGKLSDTAAGSEAALFGHLIHEMFQIILAKDANTRNSDRAEMVVEGKAGSLDIESFYEAAEEALYRHHEDMFAAGVSEKDARLVLHKITADIMRWYEDFMSSRSASRPEGVQVGEGRQTRNIFVREVDDIEELIWSPVFGLKGKIDATIHLLIDGIDVGIGILELKTGKSGGYAALYHSAQVILYNMLLSDRKDRWVNHALITYIPYQEALKAVRDDQSQAGYTGHKIELLQTQSVIDTSVKNKHVAASRAEFIGLIMQRNKLASYLRLQASIEDLPPILQGKAEVCAKCFSNETCLVQHKLIENGTSRTVADGPGTSLFEEKTSHLKAEHAEYFRHWSVVLAHEQECSSRQMKEIWVIDGVERERKGLCIASLKLQVSVGMKSHCCVGLLSPGQLVEARFERHPKTISRLQDWKRPLRFGQISKGDFVVVSAEQNLQSNIFNSSTQGRSTWQCALTNGFVSAISETSITVAVDRSLEAWVVRQGLDPEDVVWRLDRQEGSHSSYFVARTAIGNIFASDTSFGTKRLRELIVDLQPPEYKDECSYATSQDGKAKFQDLVRLTLNQDQETAVRLSLKAKDYLLILGMPGTGKTTTLVAIVLATALHGGSVLLCSHTNSAVDNILSKLLALGFENFIRLGRNLDVIDRKIHPYHFSKVFTQNRSVCDLEKELQRHQVVATTCLGIGHPLLRRRQKFDLVVIDEASQILQPVCLGPLQFAKGPFILVGDHYQLPPLLKSSAERKQPTHNSRVGKTSSFDQSMTSSSSTAADTEEGQQDSLFRRLCGAHPAAVVALTRQYRMAEEIMELANDLIYSESLRCGSAEISTQSLQVPVAPLPLPSSKWKAAVLSPAERVVFLSVEACDTSDSLATKDLTRMSKGHNGSLKDSFGRVNEGEASIVFQVLELLVSGGVAGTDITVLSPFRAQVSFIKDALAKSGSDLLVDLHEIEVSTIDQYQGKDNDCVIVSFVRNRLSSIGPLLKDWRRINVGLTRAKKKLILIGSAATLRNGCKVFERMVKLLEDGRKIHTVESQG